MGHGLDQKKDPKQISIGKYALLQNTIFQKEGLLQKRNGYGSLPSLPDNSSSYLTTFNGNLTAIGNNLKALSSGSQQWTTKGNIQPVELSTLPLIRSNLNQTQCDSAISGNGLICTVYTEIGGSTSPQYYYVIADSTTGQNIISPTVISANQSGSARVFLLRNYFVIVFSSVISSTNHLQYIAINITNPTSVSAITDVSTTYTPASTVAFDGVVANNSLYLAWNGSDVGGAIRMTYIDSTLTQHNTVVFTGHVATIMSVCADVTGSTPVIYAAFFDSASTDGYVLAVNQQLNTVLAPTLFDNAFFALNVTVSAQNQFATIFYEVQNNYGYDSSIPTNYLNKITVTQGGTIAGAATIVRSVGLASKSFIIAGTIYVMTTYSSPYQPTYFLINSSGNIISKIAYSNGGGYLTLGLPSVSIFGTTASTDYLVKDLIEATNKTQGATSSTPVYSQTGVNSVSFDLTTAGLNTAEIGNNLNLSGGFLWAYDGYSLTEQGFHLWPDSIELTGDTTGGFMTAQQYYYQVTYEWSDNQGNVFRSAPSIPVTITTTGTTSSVTIDIPTLRLTYKIANPVKIVIYRWSAGQQTYFQTTSITSPLLNDPTIDYVSFVDVNADTSQQNSTNFIEGSNILYTTGGVVENIGPPATDVMTLYKSRLFLVDSEDKNLLWYSKQVIENTPVEMSDLFTIYVAPTTSAAANTGPITALSALDDKLIIFKNDAIYYITGTGPDNTGANNDFSEPIFITSTVGCSNQSSIVFMPQGLMFQSDKGIWLLGRDLSTSYIGAPVEDDASFPVQSAVNVPATNQVRFTLATGITLMYDYYFNEWGSFVNVPAISSCIYKGLHTYINSLGAAFQETPSKYLDGSSPVLISLITGWINPAGLQGYLRSYWFYILGQYLTPHKLQVSIAYDYNSSPTQSTVISPDNYSPPYGGSSPYGAGSPYGGPGDLEYWRVFLAKQRCLAFQISINEIYDSSFGIGAGEGLTISGLNLVVGIKSGWSTISAANSVG